MMQLDFPFFEGAMVSELHPCSCLSQTNTLEALSILIEITDVEVNNINLTSTAYTSAYVLLRKRLVLFMPKILMIQYVEK